MSFPVLAISVLSLMKVFYSRSLDDKFQIKSNQIYLLKKKEKKTAGHKGR